MTLTPQSKSQMGEIRDLSRPELGIVQLFVFANFEGRKRVILRKRKQCQSFKARSSVETWDQTSQFTFKIPALYPTI